MSESKAGPWVALLFLVFFQVVSAAPRLEIRGVRTYEKSEAKRAIEDHWQNVIKFGLTTSRADDAAFLLQLAMRREGYAKALVSWDIVGKETLRLTVVEGDAVFIDSFKFGGHPIYKKSDLRDLVLNPLRQRKHLLESQKLPYVESEIESGLRRIRAFYESEGYRQAEVQLNKPFERKGNDVVIRVKIEPGPRSYFGQITLPEERDSLSELVEISERFLQRPLTRENLDKLESRLRFWYRDRGFDEARVEFLENAGPSEGSKLYVNLKVEIEPGTLVTVRHVHFKGLQEVKEAFMEERFEDFVGNAYDSAAVDQVFKDLARTGLFEDLSIRSTSVGEKMVDLEVTVTESEMREFGVFGGFGSFEGWITGVLFEHRNLMGRSRNLVGRVELNGRGFGGDVSFLDPWFLDRDNLRFHVRLSANTLELQGYEKFDVALRSNLFFQLSEEWQLSLHGDVINTEISKENFLSPFGATSYRTHSLGVGFIWDRRDHELRPRKGSLFEGRLDYGSSAFGSEVDFLRSSIGLSLYHTSGRTHFRFGARSGWIQPLGATGDLPVDMRNFNGGSTSVRSFPEREMLPQELGGYPTGDRFRSIFNFEVGRMLSDSLELTVFADAGNLRPRPELEGMRYAIGLGVRWDLPVGPLRIDYGWNPNARKHEPSGAFHIAFGFAF